MGAGVVLCPQNSFLTSLGALFLIRVLGGFCLSFDGSLANGELYLLVREKIDLRYLALANLVLPITKLFVHVAICFRDEHYR